MEATPRVNVGVEAVENLRDQKRAPANARDIVLKSVSASPNAL